MTKTAIKEKVLNMEAELEVIKKAIEVGPDFLVDEKIWKVIKPTLKKAGKKLYAEQYSKK
ncbi:MAG: hypothetical protein A3I89_04445 [Candidatus Harrisonbacteria bacterium RIFCSPLOWO2_02_FULL_41_11]|uniref:Uncharacterized protein n=1 Tax=Candidatus Harrisonbacteria bacterium RIFCSPHIGHO2_02_FULL_42_16 TaxID=1798404 RepID=A0A1G1ZH12_9BACT|nr:MAG: hypothetical protein A3B92_01445 [Candidatus Harrisonbacteria bacterium RIFCSPHIGHO2_02_FULL_42_16]OGY66422.1 MAG: hypothetical protein A3I89_04445 [Candidatus Harrisonbacteria bacterium RIFCSPLOWO2_02_FULL_41_11]